MDRKIFLSFVAPALLFFGTKSVDGMQSTLTREESSAAQGLRFGKIAPEGKFFGGLVRALGVKSLDALQKANVEDEIITTLKDGDAKKISMLAYGLSGTPLQGKASEAFLEGLRELAREAASFEYVGQILKALDKNIPAEKLAGLQGVIELTGAVKAVLEGKDFTFNGVSVSHVEDAKDAKFVVVKPVISVFFGISSDGKVVFSEKKLAQDTESSDKVDRKKIGEQLEKLAPLFDSINNLEREPLSDDDESESM